MVGSTSNEKELRQRARVEGNTDSAKDPEVADTNETLEAIYNSA